MAGKALSPIEDFSAQLDVRMPGLSEMLPGNVSPARFREVTLAAVRQNPSILQATPNSVLNAVTKAAQDGIMPDGREGVITVYGKQAVWNPMVGGIRKRARETDNILISSEVVFDKDIFAWDAGDNPRIEHSPHMPLSERGEPVAVYAIFRQIGGEILHREVMDAGMVAAVRAQSKAPDSLMWKKFWTEGWRKAVIRRGIKSVPVSDSLSAVIRRDDDNYDMESTPSQIIQPPPPKRNMFEPDEASTEIPDPEQPPEPEHDEKTEVDTSNVFPGDLPSKDNPDAESYTAALSLIDSFTTVQSLRTFHDKTIKNNNWSEETKKAFNSACERRRIEINKGKNN